MNLLTSNMRKTVIVAFALLVFNCVVMAQQASGYGSNNELQTLCRKLGTDNLLVGLGESTHGTREFTLIRTEMVKCLVLDHKYRLFVLEADYMPCTRINEYLATGVGNPAALLLSLRLWPWIHTDFMNLLLWLREYNLSHPDSMVEFAGMDSQYGAIYAPRDTVLAQYPEEAQEVYRIADSGGPLNQKIEALRSLIKKASASGTAVDVRLHYYICCLINRLAKSNAGKYDVRDENMAELFQSLRSSKGDTVKAILWAHNGHISKQGASLNERTAFGSYLAKKYGKDYAAIGQDFKEGEFLAVDFENVKERKISTFTLFPTKETLAAGLEFSDKNLVVLNCKQIGREYINAIGAIYVRKPEKRNSFYSAIRNDNEFDYLIVSAVSTPVTLLEGYLNK